LNNHGLAPICKGQALGCELQVVGCRLFSKQRKCNPQPTTCDLRKNFPALTSAVFSPTLPPLEKENLRAFSRRW
jgi:hypothetical protein